MTTDNKTQNALYVLSTAVLLCTLWFILLTTTSPQVFQLLGILTVSLSALSVILLWRKTLIDYTLIVAATFGISTLLFLFFLWNIGFRAYAESYAFNGNIFRSIFTEGLRAPMYGRPFPHWVKPHYWPQLIPCIILIGYTFGAQSLKLKKWIWGYVLVFTTMLIGFSWHINFEKTFFSLYCHYETFASDMTQFYSLEHLFSNYVNKMSVLSEHNNHYPPGLLLLIFLSNGYLKPLVLLSCLLSIWPFYLISKSLGLNEQQQKWGLLLLASSGALLFLPKVAVSPIVLPIALFLFYLLIRKSNSNLLDGLFIGLLAAVYLLLSFSIFFFSIFMGIFMLKRVIKSKTAAGSIWIKTLTSLSIVIGVYVILNILYSFNILEVLKTARVNNAIQMDSFEFNGIRYLITSTGNLLAYLLQFGAIVFFIVAIAVKQKVKLSTIERQLITSLELAIFLLAFSNQLFLEVERIWVFFTPFVCITIGVILAKINLTHKKLPAALISLNCILTLAFCWTINYCM